MRAIEVSRAFLAPLDRAVDAAYYESGRSFNESLRADARAAGTAITIRFDPGNPRAAGWLRAHSSRLVTEIVEDQRMALRAVLEAGMAEGTNPRSVALDVVGRVNRASGRREGGLIGLHSGQIETAARAREELASGDPARMEAYFDRKLRARKFDKVVRAAIREGRPVRAPDIAQIVAGYRDNMLRWRGEMIARTEALTALSEAQNENMLQVIEAGGFRQDQVVKTWRAASDGRTRDTHVALNGKSVRMSAPFVSPSGAHLMFPRDSSLGAPASETIACRCRLNHAIDWKGTRANGL